MATAGRKITKISGTTTSAAVGSGGGGNSGTVTITYPDNAKAAIFVWKFIQANGGTNWNVGLQWANWNPNTLALSGYGTYGSSTFWTGGVQTGGVGQSGAKVGVPILYSTAGGTTTGLTISNAFNVLPLGDIDNLDPLGEKRGMAFYVGNNDSVRWIFGTQTVSGASVLATYYYDIYFIY